MGRRRVREDLYDDVVRTGVEMCGERTGRVVGRTRADQCAGQPVRPAGDQVVLAETLAQSRVPVVRQRRTHREVGVRTPKLIVRIATERHGLFGVDPAMLSGGYGMEADVRASVSKNPSAALP
ncbi:hypothetical protein [Nocardia abscessus]|uniref:hypothetical protein n=1 Tax=Nocardia abscessus TaxID=120957 RepID=UPI0024571868|nr:hypothetical protein [Nocardia abscessus]